MRVIEDRDRETAMTILGLSRDLIRNGVNVEETKFARIYQLPEEEIRSVIQIRCTNRGSPPDEVSGRAHVRHKITTAPKPSADVIGHYCTERH